MATDESTSTTDEDSEAAADTAATEDRNEDFSAGQESSEATEETADTADQSDQDTDWKAEAEKWKALARKHEQNAKKASKASSSELDELREQVSSHESDVTEARNALATERLHTKLARAGMPEEDATSLIEHLDPSRLLEDGQPSTKAIDAVAASLSRSLTRGVDEDQGQASEAPSFSPDQWLRKKARR